MASHVGSSLLLYTDLLYKDLLYKDLLYRDLNKDLIRTL